LVFDCEHNEELPGVQVYPSGSTDVSVKRAASLSHELLRFFGDCFHRNSVDGAGMDIVASVHYSKFFSNAFWNEHQMVYGDGDGEIFLDFTSSNDFAGHELTHGVTQYSAGLTYSPDEPGALNESISDVFGSIFRQWQFRQAADQADWLIGADLMGPTSLARGWICIRDLSDPNNEHCLNPQPGDYTHYVPHGEPHDNSGIPNHAFFLAATALGGFSWEKAGQIWFGALTDKSATGTMTFAEFGDITVKVSAKLFPCDVSVAEHVRGAWKAVGVAVT
jgi:Zn-dependent metalloprotease